MKTDHGFNLGDEAKDTITGFGGVIVAITTWLNGCVRMTLQPREMKDGKPIDAITFDVEQLARINAAVAVPGTRSGGPCDDAKALSR